MSRHKIVAMIMVLMTLALGVALALRTPPEPPIETQTASAEPTETTTEVPAAASSSGKPESRPETSPPSDEEPDENAEATAAVAAPALSRIKCSALDPITMFTNETVRGEIDRLAPLGFFGDDMAMFRGVDLESMESFAVQGESRAMALAGVMHWARSTGAPDQLIADFLTDGMRTMPLGFLTADTRRPSEDVKQYHLEQARHWLWEAATHGRLITLAFLGEIDEQLKISPVDAGLISDAELEQFTEQYGDRVPYGAIYRHAAGMVAPELATGIGEEIFGDATTFAGLRDVAEVETKLLELATSLADQLLNESVQNGTGIPVIAASEFTSKELEARICDRQ